MLRTSPRKVRATCLAYHACTGRRRCHALVAGEGCSIVRLVEQVHPEVLERAISLTLATAASRERPSPPGGDSIEDPLVESQPGLASPVCVHNVDLLMAVASTLERNLLPVGRPDGVVVGEITRVELSNPGPVRVHDEDMEVATIAGAREHDPPTVGRPARVVALAFVGGELRDARAVRVHAVQLVVATLGSHEQDLLAVGRPGGRGIVACIADCMEATGLTARERVASALPSDACALVTGGQSCTPLDLMLI